MIEGKYDSSQIGPMQASAVRSIGQIREDVRELIDENDAIYPKDIYIDVQDGVVTLRGKVRDQIAFDEAVQAAREVIGVIEVRNELEISG